MNNESNICVRNIVVPEYVRYIGDWKEYRLEDYPFPHILNKVLTGCGYTEFCLNNWQNIILLSPRKFLLKNKRDQHINNFNVYYAENCIERSVNYELDLSKDSKVGAYKEESDGNEGETITVLEFKNKIRKHWEYCQNAYHLPCKILVTYDSFRHVIEALGDDIQYFQIVVDEFQSIFIDARFKSEAELELVNHLKALQSRGLTRICYVSATPMLEKYLAQLDEFKDLPYFRFDWETANPSRTKKPRIDIKYVSRTLSEYVNVVIKKYLSGKFEVSVIDRGDGLKQEIISNEAVLFLNSVKGICQAIRTNKLLPYQCNILCAETPENERRVRDAFNSVIKEVKAVDPGFCGDILKRGSKVIGEIPVKGAPHKMFTFCTRTVYLGSDFYSTCARTFVFSDSNIDCLSVDISLDLEQILGRQRLDENPWKNSATLFVKTINEGKKTTKEEFQAILDRKITKSNTVLMGYESVEESAKHAIAEKLLISAKAEHYKNDYVAVNTHGGSDLKPVFNNLMMLSEMRAFEVQQEDYADRFTVLNSLNGRNLGSVSERVVAFVENFNNIKYVKVKLRLLYDFYNSTKGNKDWEDVLELVSPKYKDYFTVLGPDRVYANGFQEADIKRELLSVCTNSQVTDKLINAIYNEFKVNEKYSNTYAKDKLNEIYQRVGYSETAKASQLENYFIIKPTKFKDSEGKKVNGFLICYKK